MNPLIEHEQRLIALEKQQADLLSRTRHPRRKVTYSDVNLYVRTDGSDSNDGSANTAGKAFLTIAKALTVAQQYYASPYSKVQISVADGTYAQTASLTYGNHQMGGGIWLVGNSGTPANCVIRADTNGMWLNLFQYPNLAPYFLDGFTLAANTGIASNLALARWRSQVHLSNMRFGSAGTGAQVYAVEYALITMQTSYSIVGGAGYHMFCDRHSLIEDPGGAITCTITGTPAFSGAFVQTVHGLIQLPNATFSGAITGKSYVANNLGEIQGTFPAGTIAGTTANGGIKT